MMSVVSISGSRRLDAAGKERVRARLRQLAEGTLVVAGGCTGVDEEAAHFCYGLGHAVHVVLPADRSCVDPAWQEFCTSHEEMAAGSNYRARNRRVVELGNLLLAFPECAENHPKSRYSGTWMTVRLVKKPVEIFVLQTGAWWSEE